MIDNDKINTTIQRTFIKKVLLLCKEWYLPREWYSGEAFNFRPETTLWIYIFSRYFSFNDKTAIKYIDEVDWNVFALFNKQSSISYSLHSHICEKGECRIKHPIHQLSHYDLIKSFYSSHENYFANFKKPLSLSTRVTINRLFEDRYYEVTKHLKENDPIAGLICSYFEHDEFLSSLKSEYWHLMNWEVLSGNPAFLLPYPMEEVQFLRHFIAQTEKFSEFIDWKQLCTNPEFPLDERILDKYEGKINWEVLSGNKNQKWNREIIERFKDKWHWDKLSMNSSVKWDEELLVRFYDKINWNLISKNPSLDFTSPFIEEDGKDLLNWKGIEWEKEYLENEDGHTVGTGYSYKEHGVSANPGFPWQDIYYLKTYERELDWSYIHKFNRKIEWDLAMVDQFNSYLPWAFLFLYELTPKTERVNVRFDPWSIMASSLKLSNELIVQSLKNLNLVELFRNKSLNWTFELFHLVFMEHFINQYRIPHQHENNKDDSLGDQSILPEEIFSRIQSDFKGDRVFLQGKSIYHEFLLPITFNNSIMDSVFKLHLDENLVDELIKDF